MPALDTAGVQVRRDVVDAAVDRIEVARRGHPRRITHLRRTEAGGRRLVRRAQPLRRLLRDCRRHDVRAVEREQVLAAETIEVHVARAVGGAQHRLVVQAVGRAEAGRPVVAIRIDQRAIVDRAILRLQQRARRRVEVGQIVVVFPLRRGELVAHAEVQRQRRRHAPVVLQIAEVHALTQLEHERTDELVAAARAHQEVGEVVGRRIRRRARRTRELAAIGVVAVLRMHVIDRGVDRLILVAGLQRVTAENPRVVRADVGGGRILELRIAALTANRRPAGDVLLRRAAAEIRIARQPRDAIQLQHVGTARAERRLARFGLRHADADFEQRFGRHLLREAGGILLVEHFDVGVRRSADVARNGRRLEVVQLAVAETEERVRARRNLLIDLDVELVVLVGLHRQRIEVVRDARACRQRQARQHRARERRDRRLRDDAVGIDLAGQRIDDGLAHRALAQRFRRQARDRHRALFLAIAFVVREEERAVAEDWTAEHAAELVALHLGLAGRTA